MLYAHILVAYDGSNESDLALSHAVQLCDLLPGAKLEVVHVFNVPSLMFGEALVTAPADVSRIEYEHAESIVDKARTRLAGRNGAEARLLQGAPGKVILAHAEEAGCDLIILGSRGLSTLGEFMLGSVSHHVVQHAKVPVLIVK
ncbi:universal stress protein [Paenibacillus mucilaginosus]|uniref:Universal stress protein n=4 Tax=Paenibacillus mucilaginosus TaxID=61624 RepID=H6N912_9BACL|nr:universal stress protein [Paenibacillus mucilaginosus]AEI39505.1 UspA domain-containing protein [Paenibacillus mucilaginosus KNP414]AFC27758.1 UspA domain-containing protein [Paenibacillus mucilaginosus 3016]AFH59913.1 universal stress protein UspA [Paenibacillus mucilaginosus K02]MCG7214673.1 universal stress protein [Paenibacillus mucilaginosus]WDM28466.1 universal stress protein [Paenibacillus mucilaginosus]